MRSHPRIVPALLLMLMLPALSQPLGGRIVVKCIDGSECPDVTRRTLTPAQAERCERICDLINRCPKLADSCRAPLACDEPCDATSEELPHEPCGEPTFTFTTPICATRCVITAVPARDLPPTNHAHVRVMLPMLVPLPIADDLLDVVLAHDSREFGESVEHVPIVHRFELAPGEGIGSRAPPHHTAS